MRQINLIRTAMCLGAMGMATTASAGLVLTGVTPVTQIGSTNYSNPNWGSWFTDNSGGAMTATSPTDMEKQADLSVLNFETAQGFDPATQIMNAGGDIFAGTSTIAPFTLTNALDSVTLTNGRSVQVQYRQFSYDTTTPTNSILSDASSTDGVFLLADRTTGTPVMVSGTQGLTAGEISGSGAYRGGVYLNFDTNLSAFSTTLNTADTLNSSPTYVIALYDASNSLLGVYRGGVSKGKSLYFGVSSSDNNIRSVWIGQTTSSNAIVIDDVGFVPAVPEPAGLMILGLGGLLLKRRTRK